MKRLFRLMFIGEAIEGSTSFGSELNLDGSCQHCLAGTRRIGNAQINLSRLKNHHLVITVEGEILISEALKAQIEASLDDVSFAPVSIVGGRSSLRASTFFEIAQSFVLPRLHIASEVYRSSVCCVCRRGGHSDFIGGRKTILSYSQKDVACVNSVQYTWEQFGGTIRRMPLRNSVVPVPLIIVSEEFKNLLVGFGGIATEFEAVDCR